MTSWDQRFLDLAQHVAGWSKDPSTKVGAVIVNSNRHVIGLGYNGFPRGVPDNESEMANRETKLALTIHAETNAVLNATASVSGCALYVWPFMPCSNCAGMVVNAGIARVVAPLHSSDSRWAESFERSARVFQCAGVVVDLRP